MAKKTKQTSTKDTKATKAKAKAPKRIDESALMAEYDHRTYDAKGLLEPKTAPIVAGSLKYETKGKYAGKQTVERTCAFSGQVFRLATSDLHQKFVTDESIKAIRTLRAKAKRAEKRAEKDNRDGTVAEVTEQVADLVAA